MNTPTDVDIVMHFLVIVEDAFLGDVGEEGDWVGDGLGRKPTVVAGTVPRTMYCEEVFCCRELTVVKAV